MNSDWIQRLTVLVVGLICVVGNVQAGNKTYYYQATVSVSPSGSGKVYIATEEGTSYNENLYQETMTISGSKDEQQEPYLQRLVFKALDPQKDSDPSNDGWEFDYWKINGKKISGSILTNSNTYEISSENENNPTTIIAVAYYKQIAGWVKVRVAGNEGGSVSISKANNVQNDDITISATASDSYTFLGWNTSENDVTNFVFTDAVVPLTVSTAVTYYAHFAKATTDYCTLKNVSSRKYLSLYGDYTATKTASGYVFTNSLKTIPGTEANNNPLIVFKRVTNSGTGYLSTDLSNSSGVITTNTLIGQNTPLTFSSQGNGIYRISATIDDKTYYLCDDDGSEFVSLQSSNTNGSEWEITIMSANAGFGINANDKYTRGGKYYTSMYAPFAYKLGEGVNAYYLDLDADNYDETTNTLTLSEISSGNVVPENMAVIIECSSANNPTGNQLLPVNKYTISDDQKENYGSNILIGYNHIVCHEENGYYQEVMNDKEYMYVFSIKNNNLGFYHYSGAIIPKNKAYLKLSVRLEELADYLSDNPNPIKLAFGSQFDDDLLNSIRLSNEEADDTDLPIYNLQGVQVKNPEKGIYIRGGKKYLVK